MRCNTYRVYFRRFNIIHVDMFCVARHIDPINQPDHEEAQADLVEKMGSEMSKIALNTSERILLKVPTAKGYEWLDPQLIRGATYQDVADEATAYGATEIRRFDEAFGNVEDIGEDVLRYSDVDVTGDDVPVWVRQVPSFSTIRSEEITASRQSMSHERSFRSSSIYLGRA